MSLWTGLRLASRISATPVSSVLASPWSPSTLRSLVVADIIGRSPIPDRADAMRVPSIAKGRALIAGQLARLPLVTLAGDTLTSSPAWLDRTSTSQSPHLRMLWTLDDLIFGGLSLWAVQRAGVDGPILDAMRIPPEWWEIDPDLRVTVHGQPAGAHEVVLFEGPQDGLLRIGAETIQGARDVERAWMRRVKSPVPLMELHETTQDQITDEEAAELVEAWDVARSEGGTAFTPFGIETKAHGQMVTDLFVQGRNAVRLDVANLLNLPAALLDGSPSAASLTYSTKDGARNEFADYSLTFWADPITARLSQDDVTPPGLRVAFDWSSITTPDAPATGPSLKD